ncbi:ABC transporter permease subunit [Falsibacillus albus]|uniref:ABC transporter permease subunit n=1 Tax=Falsibacillus albus TaxID=2478915 RepID=A0A3L7JT31_9BACI|nr:ABC transporter permease subunit [Falsibacillus albus]RLQ93199.1 ABC transporter permease subunit [Falsibacillus albus]
MVYIRKLVVQLLLWLVTTCLFLSILFLPADTSYKTGRGHQFAGASYHYTLKKHVENVENFFAYIKDQKGLGRINGEETMWSYISERVVKSMLLVIPALLFGYLLGVAKGVFDFRMKHMRLSFLGEGSTWLMLSLPDLFLIICIQLGLMFLYSKGLFFHVDLFGSDKMDNYVMGIIFLAIYPVFYIANVTNASLQDEQGQDYIRTAKAKGISSLRLLYVHIMKNSASRILAHANTITLYVLSNLFIVEKLTDFRGAAYYLFNALDRGANFYIGAQHGIDVVPAAGYTIFFTLMIFGSNAISQVFKIMITPPSSGVGQS